ncbi:hypothetical protein [Clostridium sp.]|uniref:hypothetical protein n=1 Tax=Clostridium sp. TaxID=1506 RepID=UPI002FCC6F75
MNIDEENIHRLNEFAKITNKLYGNISIFDLKNIVLHPYGLFKYSKGEKILFINKVENVHYEILAKKLINIINEQNHNISIFYGSIKNKIYKSVEYSEDKYGKCNNNGIGIIKENG